MKKNDNNGKYPNNPNNNDVGKNLIENQSQKTKSAACWVMNWRYTCETETSQYLNENGGTGESGVSFSNG